MSQRAGTCLNRKYQFFAIFRDFLSKKAEVFAEFEWFWHFYGLNWGSWAKPESEQRACWIFIQKSPRVTGFLQNLQTMLAFVIKVSTKMRNTTKLLQLTSRPTLKNSYCRLKNFARSVVHCSSTYNWMIPYFYIKTL